MIHSADHHSYLYVSVVFCVIAVPFLASTVFASRHLPEKILKFSRKEEFNPVIEKLKPKKKSVPTTLHDLNDWKAFFYCNITGSASWNAGITGILEDFKADIMRRLTKKLEILCWSKRRAPFVRQLFLAETVYETSTVNSPYGTPGHQLRLRFSGTWSSVLLLQ